MRRAQITQQAMIWKDWLRSTISSGAYSKFTHYKYVEEPESRKRVSQVLANTIYSYHFPSRTGEQSLLRKLRFVRTAMVLQGDMRPHDERTRRGNFAEILACEFAKEVLGYEIPVYRFHFNPNIEQSMKGDDILSFKFEQSGNGLFSVLIGEAKYRNTFSSDAVWEAYNALALGYRPYPSSIDFVSAVLHHEGNNQKAELVDRIKRQLSSRTSAVSLARLIMLVTKGEPRDPFSVIEELPHIIENLIVVNICLGSEADVWINTLYEMDVQYDQPLLIK